MQIPDIPDGTFFSFVYDKDSPKAVWKKLPMKNGVYYYLNIHTKEVGQLKPKFAKDWSYSIETK